MVCTLPKKLSWHGGRYAQVFRVFYTSRGLETDKKGLVFLSYNEDGDQENQKDHIVPLDYMYSVLFNIMHSDRYRPKCLELWNAQVNALDENQFGSYDRNTPRYKEVIIKYIRLLQSGEYTIGQDDQDVDACNLLVVFLS